jgi:hypothetical protein
MSHKFSDTIYSLSAAEICRNRKPFWSELLSSRLHSIPKLSVLVLILREDGTDNIQ